MNKTRSRVKVYFKMGGPCYPLRDITVLKKFCEDGKYGWDSFDFKEPTHFFNITGSGDPEYEEVKHLSLQVLNEAKCSFHLLPVVSFYAFINEKEYGLVAGMRDLMVVWPDGVEPPPAWAPPRPKLPLNGVRQKG